MSKEGLVFNLNELAEENVEYLDFFCQGCGKDGILKVETAFYDDIENEISYCISCGHPNL